MCIATKDGGNPSTGLNQTAVARSEKPRFSRITKSVPDHTRRELYSLAFKCQLFVCQFPRRELHSRRWLLSAHVRKRSSLCTSHAYTRTAIIRRRGTLTKDVVVDRIALVVDLRYSSLWRIVSRCERKGTWAGKEKKRKKNMRRCWNTTAFVCIDAIVIVRDKTEEIKNILRVALIEKWRLSNVSSIHARLLCKGDRARLVSRNLSRTGVNNIEISARPWPAFDWFHVRTVNTNYRGWHVVNQRQ